MISPEKSVQVLTPVRFLDSPPRVPDNATHIKLRLDTIVSSLKDNYQKWVMAQARGLSLCHSIEAIKTRCLAKDDTSTSTEALLYPKELVPYCKKLAIITSIFGDIARNTQASVKQLRAMLKLAGCADEVFYRSWKMAEFVRFAETLADCYEHEAKVKQHVMEELPHFSTREGLVCSSTIWEYPQYVNGGVKLLLALLSEETKIK